MKKKKFYKLVIFNFILLELIFIFSLIFPIIKYYIAHKNYTTDNTEQTANAATIFGSFVLHPYLGFVNDPHITPANPNVHINKFGFIGPEPFDTKSDNKIIIGIFGGSFAQIYYLMQEKPLIDKIKAIPKFKNKTIKIYSVALGGYKQPQQLMALNYFLILRAQFDIVVNIDGFNEVALADSENVPSKVSSFYPRAWNLYSKNALDIESAMLITEIKKHEQNIENLKKLYSTSILKYFKFIYNSLYTKEQNAVVINNKKLASALNKNKNSYQTLGPETEYYNSTEIKKNIINVWKESSIQMNNLAKTNNILYLHFLSPNQYVKDSKKLTEEEKKIAYSNTSSYKPSVEEFYPLLINEGQELKKLGIHFTDLTNIYKNNNNTIYIDNCCHINLTGYEIITDYIIKEIVDNYKN